MTQDDGSRSAPDASGRALWQRLKAGGPAMPAASGRPVGDLDIAAWLDGRLSPDGAARVERHLVAHPQALRAALDIRNALADAARAPVPQRLIVRGQALVDFDVERKAARGGLAGWRRSLELAAVGAAFLVVIAGGFSLGGGTQEAFARTAQADSTVELILNPLGAFRLPGELIDGLHEQGGR